MYRGLYEFSEELSAAQDTESEKWGFIDKNGIWIIKPQYDNVSSFHDGLAVATPSQDDLENGESHAAGYIDKSGKQVIAYQYVGASLFSNDRAFVSFAGSQGHSPVSAGLSLGSAYTEIYMIDKDGNALGVLPYWYLPFKADIEKSADGGDYIEWDYDWLILADKEFASKVTGDWMRGGDRSTGHPWKNTEYFNSMVINKNMDIVFDGYEYNCNILRVLNERGDLYVIDKTTGLMGIVNISGEWIVDPKCNYLFVFADEVRLYANDSTNEAGGHISQTLEIEGIGGNNPPSKPFETDEERALILYEKITQVDGVEKHGFVDQDGNTVVDCIYDAVGRIDPNDGTCFGAQIDGLWGIADRNGNWLIQPMFLDIKGIATWGNAFPRAR